MRSLRIGGQDEKFFDEQLSRLEFDAKEYSEEALHQMMDSAQREVPVENWRMVRANIEENLSSMKPHTEQEIVTSAIIDHAVMLFLLNLPVLAIVTTMVTCMMLGMIKMDQLFACRGAYIMLGIACVIWVTLSILGELKLAGSATELRMREENREIEEYNLALKVLNEYISCH